MNIGYFVINLDGSVERFSSIKEQLEADEVNFKRISAFDGRGKNPADFKDYHIHEALNYMGRPLKGGELGCYYSHIKCIDEFLRSDHDYVVVIEDDALWSVGTKNRISSLLAKIEENKYVWEVINIGFNKNKIYSVLSQLDQFDLIRAHYFPMTTTCIIWNRDGAKNFIKDVPYIYAPIDNVIREWQTTRNLGLATLPPLVSVSGAESEIDVDLVKRGKAERVKGYWLKRQTRLWRQKIFALVYKFKNKKA